MNLILSVLTHTGKGHIWLGPVLPMSPYRSVHLLIYGHNPCILIPETKNVQKKEAAHKEGVQSFFSWMSEISKKRGCAILFKKDASQRILSVWLWRWIETARGYWIPANSTMSLSCLWPLRTFGPFGIGNEEIFLTTANRNCSVPERRVSNL